MAALQVHAQELPGSNLRPLRMTAKQLAFHHQDVRTPSPMASESASLDHLLAHLESSKQALEHQVQQLLQENRLSKSAKKEQQWQMEGERLHSKLDSMNVILMEKEERVRQLENELRDVRGSVQQLQNRCREAEKEKERGALERTSMQADMKDAQLNLQNLERECKLKHEVTEKQRRALESLANKVEKQKESFQSQLEDARMKLIESSEREQKYEEAAQHASQQVVEKERQLRSLRDAHEKLLAVQKGKHAEDRQEVEEVILALESTHAKSEGQKVVIKELEQELRRMKKEAHQIDARAAAAEADAMSKASMLEKVQLELKNASTRALLSAKSKAQFENLKSEVLALKRSRQDVENTLSEESALRFKAECALNEYKVREKSFLKIEQDTKVLQEEVKWRNEQFESLEEAHNKMRDQFHQGLTLWSSEKAAILKEIEVLTENVQSRDIVIHDLRSQVKVFEQSLAHEENCRKLLEFQLADAKENWENVSAEHVAAKSILENLRENSKKELSFLKSTLAERDSQLKELHVKQRQIDRDQKELLHLEVELEKYKSSCEHLQQTLKNGTAPGVVKTVYKSRDPWFQEEMENLRRSLTDAEATIAKKEVEMKELEMELDRTRTLSELLRTSLSEAEEKRLEGNTGAIQTVEELSASLSVNVQHSMELQTELERLQGIVNDVRECNGVAERRIIVLEGRLRDAHSELEAKNKLYNSVLNVEVHDEVVLALRSECGILQRQANTYDLERFELQKQLDQVQEELRVQKQLYVKEKKELVTKLQHLSKQCSLKDTRSNDLLDQIEKEKLGISTLKARCATLEQEQSKQVLLAEELREKLASEKLNARVYQERAQILDASLSADALAKDASLKEIKDTLCELRALCKGGAEVETRIASIEEKLEKQDLLHGGMDDRLVPLSGELNAVVGEVERIAQGVSYLNIELNILKDDSKLTKSELETRLRAVEGLFASSCMELKEISEQVGKMNAERNNLVDTLQKKDGDLDLLNGENKSLTFEKTRFETNANGLEERLLKLVKEAESNKAIIDTLNANMKAAEEGVVTRSGELHELHDKLEESEIKNMQLLSVAEQARGLELNLRKTEEMVHDKEQRLAASEWAVQQLASEIAVSKSYLAQKEKDEAASRDRLEHTETELKAKERELTELQCDLENVVKASNEKHALLQQLTLSEDEIRHILDLTKRALEEKTASLVTSEAEVKRLLEKMILTEEALENSEERLTNEVTTNLALEKKIKRLCEDIEKTNLEATLADVDVKNLQERLKCLERTTDVRLESCERKMEKGATDLAVYQQNCAGLLVLTEKKDAVIRQLESEVTYAHKELERVLMQSDQNAQELRFVSEQLQNKTKMHSSLKVELATVDVLNKELESHKIGLEEEVRGLKSSLSVTTRDLKENALETEELKRSIEHLESFISQQGNAHAVKTKELEFTCNAVEERDNKLSKLQAEMNEAREELQKAQETVSVKEGEKRVLSLRLSELDTLVTRGQGQISQLQSSLQLARANIEVETERVWQQVAAKNEIETELDVWKGKAAALTESNAAMKAEFECAISKLQAEMNDWKVVAEHTESLSGKELETWKTRVTSLTENQNTMQSELKSSIRNSQVEVMEWKEKAEKTQFLNGELEKSMQAVQESMVGWEEMITSLADEGDETKLQMEFLLKQIHDEFRGLHADLANSKDLITITFKEGHTLRTEVLSTVQESQHLQTVISDLVRERSFWKAKAVSSSSSSVVSELQKARSQSHMWRQRAEEWESFNQILEQAFIDLEHSLLERKSDAASIADLENDLKLDIRGSFRNLRKEVEEASSEMRQLKEVTTVEAEETQREFEACVNSLQAEVEDWKEKTAVATEEGLQMKAQFEDLLKNLQSELKNWKEFEAFAREERQIMNTQIVAYDARVLEMEPSVFNTSNSINPFYQEDEGCSSCQENDDAVSQLDGWKRTKLSMAAKEGRKLTRQFRASFKHLQYELESRRQESQLKLVKHSSFMHRHDDTGLESLVKALQEEAAETRADLMDWKSKAASAAQETETLREDSENTTRNLRAEVEGWKDLSAMSAGQRTVSKRQLDDVAKQVQSLNAELQKWKDVAIEANEGATKLQTAMKRVENENDEVRVELNEWMRKALELNCVIQNLEADVEKWKQTATSRDEEYQLLMEELKQLRAELEKLKCVAANAEEEGKLAKMELLHTLGKFEDELEVMSSNSIGGCSTGEGRPFKEEEIDCSWQTSGRISNEWRHGRASELEISLQAEVEDWKQRVASLVKEQEDLKQNYGTVVQEMRLQVEASKKSTESIAEEAQVEMEVKLNDFEATGGKLKIMEGQVELQMWKQRAADAAVECASLRDAHSNVVKELQLELAQWKEKSEAASEECKSVKADLQNMVQDLEKQVYVWKQKAEKALEKVVKNLEYEDLIKALEEELCLWAQRVQESNSLELHLEKEKAHLTESLSATENELQKWKDRAASVEASIRSLHKESRLTTIPEEDEVHVTEEDEVHITEEEDEVNVGHLSDEDEDDVNIDSFTDYEVELQNWKSKAEHGELLQLQLEDLLGETQTELNEWKKKTADFSLAADFLKEELENVIEEGQLEKEELLRSIAELEASVLLWRARAQESETQLENSSKALQKWDEKAAAITQSTRSLMEEFDLTIEEGQLEKQEFYASISALKASVLVWKEKVAKGESMQLQLKRTLQETQTELQEWEDRAAVAIATKSPQVTETESILKETKQQNEKLCNTVTELEAEKENFCNSVNELESELREWKSRAQEGVSVQMNLEKALSVMEEKAAAAATHTQALKEELNRTITESSSEIQELCSAITGLELELSDMKEKADDRCRFPQLLQLQDQLTETQTQLEEWQEKATVASQAEEELRKAVEDIRAETGKLDNFIRALKEELLEWKAKSEHLEIQNSQLTSSLASSLEELQSLKEKALNTEKSSDLETELSQWKEKAQESEFLHQQTKKSLTETQIEIKDLKEKIIALNLFTDSLKDELQSENEFVSTLMTQLSSHKQNVASLQELNRQLEADLVLARDEALSRRQRMTQIFTQLQGTSDNQKELQKNMHFVQHRLLGKNNADTNQDSAKVSIFGSENFHNSSLETQVLDDFRGSSLKNPSVGKMRNELYSLKSLVSKLEHVRGNDGEQSQTSSNAGDNQVEVFEGRASREDQEPRMKVNGVRRPEGRVQKQVQSPKVMQERKGSDASIRPRGAHSLPRLKVLTDVNGNSPRASANHDKLHAVDSFCPEQSPFSRLIRSASGM